jgi:hypothetical protein
VSAQLFYEMYLVQNFVKYCVRFTPFCFSKKDFLENNFHQVYIHIKFEENTLSNETLNRIRGIIK